MNMSTFTEGELPMAFHAVTDTWKGWHTLGTGSDVTLRQRGPLPVLTYVPLKGLSIPVLSVTVTVKLSTGNSVWE